MEYCAHTQSRSPRHLLISGYEGCHSLKSFLAVNCFVHEKTLELIKLLLHLSQEWLFFFHYNVMGEIGTASGMVGVCGRPLGIILKGCIAGSTLKCCDLPFVGNGDRSMVTSKL